MIRRNLVNFILASALGLFLTSACDMTSTGRATPETGPTPTTVSFQTPTTTPQSVGTPSEDGGNVKADVIDFQVWQDFMPGIREGGPPLHATVLVEIAGAPNATVDSTRGTITILRQSGETVTKSNMRLVEIRDTSATGSGGKVQWLLAMEATPVSMQLVENEQLSGKLELRDNGSSAVLDLPQTPLMFTH